MLLLSSLLVTAVCTCTMIGEPYLEDETAQVTCYCDSALEKSKPYTIRWYNTTRGLAKTSTGTTPSVANTLFSDTYTFSNYSDNGIWNVTLTVDGTFKTYKEFPLTNYSAANYLTIEKVYTTENITLGKEASVVLEVSSNGHGHVLNADCRVAALSSGGILDMKDTVTHGGDGHIMAYFDTSTWNPHSDIVGTEGFYYVECNCYDNCTSVMDGVGCCIGETNHEVLTFHTADTYFGFTIDANENTVPYEGWIAVSLSLFAVILLFISLGQLWKFEIFPSQTAQTADKSVSTGQETNNNLSDRQNIMRVMFTWIGLWLVMPVLQAVIIMLETANVSDRIRTLFTTFYDVDMYINWIVSAFMVIYLIYNAVLYLTKSFGGRK